MGKVQSGTTFNYKLCLTVLYPYYDPIQHNGVVLPESTCSCILETLPHALFKIYKEDFHRKLVEEFGRRTCQSVRM